MNNVITILVDSAVWDCVGTNRCSVSPTPFLDSLKSETVTASKLYSYGPYTDAATRSLYTGRRTLDDYGYFFKLNTSPTNHFKVFHDNGYHTIGLYYPYYMIGKDIRKYIDSSYYTSGFIFSSEWGGLFGYYSEIIKARQLKQEEYVLLQKRLELLFDVWISFYEDALNNPESIIMISSSVGSFSFKHALNVLSEEQSLFKNNTVKYINDFLNAGLSHRLASLDGIPYAKSIDKDFIEKNVFKKHKDFFKRCYWNNVRANIWKNSPSAGQLFTGLGKYIKSRKADDITFLANYFLCLEGVHKMVRECRNQKSWQNVVSARKQFEFAATTLKERKDNRPFYLSIHILEPHHYISCFTFDDNNKSKIDEEIEVLNKFVVELGSNYVGNLTFYLSLRYVDWCLEKFAEKLKDLNIWNDTTLLVVADHGSSYSYHPLHGKHVNCFDDECYHIPMWIRNPGGPSLQIDTFHNSQDILPTLYDIVGLKIPNCLTGKSMLNKQDSHPYVLTEYMGPGCPDILGRRIWFSARDEKYVIAYKVGIFESFENGELCEVYDLERDKLAQINVCSKIDRAKIKYLLCPIEKRFEEIKKESLLFLEQLKNE